MTTPKPPPEWLKTPEVAERFRVAPTTVIRWTTTGTIPREHWFRTPGGHGHLRIRAAWVDEYLNGSGNGAQG